MSELSYEAGVFYTTNQHVAEEQDHGHKAEYHWLHIPTGKRGTSTIWVFTDNRSFGMDALLNWWNGKSDDYKYWSVE